VDKPALMKLAQSRGNSDGEAQKAFHLHGHTKRPIERLAARIVEHQHGSTGVAHELQRPHRPGLVEFILQFVFVREAVEA
jgi:metallophosphoesterase superfamily enzyme